METVGLIILLIFLFLSVIQTKFMYNHFFRIFTRPTQRPFTLKTPSWGNMQPKMTGNDEGDQVIIWMIKLFSLAMFIMIVYAIYVNHK